MYEQAELRVRVCYTIFIALQSARTIYDYEAGKCELTTSLHLLLQSSKELLHAPVDCYS